MLGAEGEVGEGSVGEVGEQEGLSTLVCVPWPAGHGPSLTCSIQAAPLISEVCSHPSFHSNFTTSLQYAGHVTIATGGGRGWPGALRPWGKAWLGLEHEPPLLSCWPSLGPDTSSLRATVSDSSLSLLRQHDISL